VSVTSYAIFVIGVGLEVCVLYSLIRNRLWRLYSYYFAYVLSMVIRTVGLFAVLQFLPDRYRELYWATESIGVALRFLVVWEVFRHTFPHGSMVHKVVSKGFAVVAFALMIMAVGIFWSYESYARFHSVYPAIDRSFGFAQAVMILGILFTARYYDLNPGPTLWGVAVAFGAWVSISTANNAMIDLKHSFLPYWELLRPLSFVMMLIIWVRAVWVYVEVPRVASLESVERMPELGQWEEGWDRTIANVRRVMHP